MKSSIVPSPALIAYGDTPISECVRRMRDHDVGSLLVMSETTGELIGIFTERDLLKSIDLIEQGGHWKKPVRSLMTRGVRTITPAEVDQGVEIMLKAGFRHLPVVSRDSSGRDRVHGVISMRDVAQSLRARMDFPMDLIRGARPIRVGVVSRDSEFVVMMKAGATAVPGALVRRIASRNLFAPTTSPHGLYRLSALVLDIDGLESEKWTEFLKRVNQDPRAPDTVIVFDPQLHTAQTAEILETLGKSSRFWVYAKPMNLAAFLDRLKRKAEPPKAE